ncbi:MULTISPECIES: PDR/VanB family oxidoreductase [unclassified Pseudomonas]|uniref:PDR/VanB family oxidoreductase n=1 Tax=unclassified Pseudomonas TaxID=196821 RepID=UPI000483A1DC|nr:MULTISPECIES: PDR/VanB family oxidoreductase [unclassified Pseudomonas]PUB40826.1 ferredoxin-NADP reductase [Pseudomonas sp. GV047]SCX36327.1 Ferredoxin-NADP reductase [Pseudomonas sp. NFACC25]SMF00452.1 Ferredoxin-NADP reductase [Pseudomonas sp. LAMO17WK12:I1]
MSAALKVQVSAARMLTPVVREFTLTPATGSLPGFSPGSHVQVHLPLAEGTVRNAYSLTSDPAQPQHYRIAVRLQDASRGGSQYLHRQVQVGDTLQISPPANLFAPHGTARLHILIAAGIGITPFMAYIAAMEQQQADFELHYLFRRGLSDAYLDELQQRLGPRLHTYDRRPDLNPILGNRPLGSHVYTCGPQPLLEAVEQHAARLGWPSRRVHSEAFKGAQPGQPFDLQLLRSGRRLRVEAEQSLLEALEHAGLQVPNLCRGGVCGQCITRHQGGAIEHRDSFLSPAEQADFLMPCVSRGSGPCVSLDL